MESEFAWMRIIYYILKPDTKPIVTIIPGKKKSKPELGKPVTGCWVSSPRLKMT